MSNWDNLTEEEISRLQVVRDSQQALRNRDIVFDRTTPHPIDPAYAISRVKYRDPDTQYVQRYTDGKVFPIVDRYSKCPQNNNNYHVLAQNRENFCMLCNKSLSPY